MSNQNTKETDDIVVDNVEEGIANEEEATNIANIINNQPPIPSAPRLSDFSSYQSRRSTNNTLEVNNEDDNDLPPLPMGAAEVSNRAEPPKQNRKVEQIDDADNGPEPPVAMLEASLNAAEKSNEMIRSSLESIDDEYIPPTPFHSSNFERDDEDDEIAKKKAKDEIMNQKPAAVVLDTSEEVEDVPKSNDTDSIYAPSREDIESMDEIRGITNTNTGRGDTNRRGWDDIGSGRINNNDSNDTNVQIAEVSTNNDSMVDPMHDVGVPTSSRNQEAGDHTDIHIPEAFLVEDGYDDGGEVYIATPTQPWWKQKRTRILIGAVIVLVGALAIALGVSLSSQSNNLVSESESTNSTVTIFVTPPPTPPITYKCFDDDDGGRNGILSAAVRSYVSQDCANNQECPIAQIYGWPINSWCVGNVKDMTSLFYNMDTFNEDINGWNTSSVTDMNEMFYGAPAFNGDVSNFNTSRVTDMRGMFAFATSFNRDLSNFNTSSVTTMREMFWEAISFNGDVSSFDTSMVTTMFGMFKGASNFNQNLCSWQDNFPYTAYTGDIFDNANCTYQDTPREWQKGPFCSSDCGSSSMSPSSSLAPTGQPFETYFPTEAEPSSPQESPVSTTTILSPQSPSPTTSSNPTHLGECFGADDGGCDSVSNDFRSCTQYGTLGKAVRAYVDQDCANIEKCEIGQTYGRPMNSWCLGSVKDMSYLFHKMDRFNEDINGWNSSSVTTMSYMFDDASSFNGDVSNFDTSRVTDMSYMFYEARSFNDDLSNFVTSSVTNMAYMFAGASLFNGNVSNFNTTSVTDMNGMFRDATSFNGDVSNFNTSSVTNMYGMFYGATSFSQNLCSWQDSFPYTNAKDIFLDSGCTYQDTPQEAQRGPFCASDCQSSQVSTTSSTPPVAATTTPPTMAPPTSVGGQSTPSTSSSCFAADDGGINGVLYKAVRSYVSQDCANNENCEIGQTYDWPLNSWCVGNVKDMSFLFSGMDTFNEDISNWNTSSVTNMGRIFSGASSFNQDLSHFDCSSVTHMDGMFWGGTSFNGDVSNFDTSSVTDMSFMFSGATSFNGDVSRFDTSSVTDMGSMFYDAESFNGDVSNFDTSRVTDIWGMFHGASSFNQDVSNFDTSRVTNMRLMFYNAKAFNGDVTSFDTSSVTDMYGMFGYATAFNQEVSNFNISSVTDMSRMFEGASSFNQDLCAWRDNFPYTKAPYIFTNTNCAYQDAPNETQKGPFCASDCQSSQVSTTSPTPPAAATTTSNPQQEEDECIDTPNFLDLYGGGCDLYALPANEAWCGAYGNDGEVGLTPNENCCVCK